jgi:serine/threonine protein kinase
VPSRRFDSNGPDELPAWLPARRTLGGFYVERRLGSGGTGSVFVAVRVEDRGTPEVEHFALKVPDYSAAAARTLSEAEFLQMFRSEASALIALPHHPNLARFVTFDSGSRPKPILVMELVEGATFEHVIDARALEMSRALAVLDDVLAGLEAMHAVGVGHLDVKPGNVLLRARGGKPGQAVLVDFGLAGRRVRPGCATGAYGAPEVWVPPEKEEASPLAVDIYAFGCLAYEALTGKVLFSASDEVAQIGIHLAHDGSPEPIRAMSQHHEHASLAELLFSTLRRDPRKRPNVQEVRGTLGRLGKELGKLRWPLDGVTIRR